MSARHGLVLFGHGSRDPLWHRPIQAVAARIAARAPQVAVRCAYLELTAPTLAEAAAALAAEGVTQLRVVPLFLGVGKHAREDLPVLIEALRQAHPAMQVECQPPVGEQEALIDLLADLALGDFA